MLFRIWSVVSDVGPRLEAIIGKMGEQRYSTRTRGERVVAPSRPAARGRYSFVLYRADPPSTRQVRLCYAISHPSHEEFGEVQKQLGIRPKSSILLSMRNPTVPTSGTDAPATGLPESQRADMSKEELQEVFGGETQEGGTRYGRPEDVELLDREGVELLLTRERNQQQISSGSGEQQANALANAAKADTNNINNQDIFSELHTSFHEHPPDALEGVWV